ncbi:hypothetical protein Ahia01_001031900 [Argonauta hians]
MFKHAKCHESVTVNKPCLPYAGEIKGGLSPGTLITVQGVTHHHERFSINFCSQPHSDPLPNTVLHIDIRFDENCVVRNSLFWDEWGREERSGCFPLRKGQIFEAIVLVEENGFKIAFNGRHFAFFARRFPMCDGRFLVLKGCADINFVTIGRNEATPMPVPFQPPFQPPQPRPVMPRPPVMPQPPGFPMPSAPVILQNPSVPMTVQMPRSHNRRINIHGYTRPHSIERFSVNLKSGNEIAFHFDVRFRYQNSHNSVVCNSYMYGDWGSEQVSNHFPFHHGAQFQITIIESPHCYEVFVNGQHFLNFNHRFHSYQQVEMLEVTGDVILTRVEM